jgi:hypothetical protein
VHHHAHPVSPPCLGPDRDPHGRLWDARPHGPGERLSPTATICGIIADGVDLAVAHPNTQ